TRLGSNTSASAGRVRTRVCGFDPTTSTPCGTNPNTGLGRSPMSGSTALISRVCHQAIVMAVSGWGGERSRDITDFSAQRRNRADGHHYVHQSLYDNLPLQPETRKVFEEAKTGRLYDTRSNKYDAPHRQYNDAVKGLFESFIERNGIQVEQ